MKPSTNAIFDTSLGKHVPKEVSHVTETLEKAGFEAYLVGGCTRDLLLGRKPKDWDVTTNATPEQIIALFPKTFYENVYGTVGVVNENSEDETLKIVEVTPYRLEAGYSDHRRPDSITFSKNLEEDLKRRDFTINAIALSLEKSHVSPKASKKPVAKVSQETLSDPYNGQKDLKDKVIRTVGAPHDRFEEDALRIIRAIRLSAELGFTINLDTAKAIEEKAPLLAKISKERIRDEFIRIIMSDTPMTTLAVAQKLGVLKYIVPELEKGVGMEQNQAHAYTVWEHLLRSCQHAADKKWPLDIRLTALFHDISKPETRRWSNETKQWTFYGHDVVGSRVTSKILENLKFPKKMSEKIVKLVRWHMFFSDTENITLSAVRRIITNVGQENIWDLMNVRVCDRVGTGRPKEEPYRLRKYHAMIEEALRDPISVGMLKIDGTILTKDLKLTPGPKIGFILHALLEEVLEEPKKNTLEYLTGRAKELSGLSDEELKKLGEAGKEKKALEEEKELAEIKKRHWVK